MLVVLAMFPRIPKKSGAVVGAVWFPFAALPGLGLAILAYRLPRVQRLRCRHCAWRGRYALPRKPPRVDGGKAKLLSQASPPDPEADPIGRRPLDTSAHVKVLQWAIYDGAHGTWDTDRLVDPYWHDVEHAIRRLDAFHYPFLYLWPTKDDSDHAVGEGREWFEVAGGPDGYWMGVSWDGHFRRRFVDPAGGAEPLVVWSSGEGFSDLDRHVCLDVNDVLEAAMYHYEHGGANPFLCWE
jgi:hypothetical protein